ncbi:MAG: hypothetical protein AB7V00_03380 [Bacilli bacterium]
MKLLIERYIYDVTRRLPEQNRDEVKKELQANINDMLPSNPTEEQIIKVLKSMGNPRILASNYSGKPKHLIAPEWMDDYLRTLKIVLIIFGSLSLAFGLIEHINNPEATHIIGIIFEVLGKVISKTIQSLFSGFALVTLVFTTVSNFVSKEKSKEWGPKNLPELPKPNSVVIKRSSSIAGLIVTIVFGSLFIFFLLNHEIYLAWYGEQGHFIVDTVMFNDEVVKIFISLFIVSILFSSFSYIIKIYHGHWNYLVAGIYTGEQIITALIGMLFVNHSNLLTTEFVSGFAELFTITEVKMQEVFSGIAIGFSAFVAFIIFTDLISVWIKTLKAKQ